jgi:hypothetical protein
LLPRHLPTFSRLAAAFEPGCFSLSGFVLIECVADNDAFWRQVEKVFD